ncbi:LuxR C-terminal-related transcriptional regulator [Luteimicrobium sp. NPDC057192]|uniref:LuxR C-terminal-related transcriptional regulator n=1 Tax=Luteimicrobium sp. NPDC057192 TaxID=3346042 RepID=UPI003625B919
MTFVHQDVLDTALQGVRSGQDVLLVGDTGSGRSTVLHALAEPLRVSGAAVVELVGTGGDPVPLGGFLSHPVLAPRTSGRWGVPEATAALAEALGARGVVLVDDVHLLDGPSRAVVAAVARQRRHQVRVVTTLPSAVLPDDGPWVPLVRGAVCVPVTPLQVNDVVALFDDVLQGSVEGGLAATVAGRTGGNPRAVEAFVSAARAAGAIARVDGRWAQTGALENVPTESVVQGLLAGTPSELRRGLETLAWFGLLGVDQARALLGDDVLAALDAAGRIVVDERPPAGRVAVSPPVLGQALRLQLTAARRAVLRERADDLLGGGGTTDAAAGPGRTAPSSLAALVEHADDAADPHDRPVHQQVAIITESVRAQASLWSRAWASRRDVASALPLLRLFLLDGYAQVDVDAILSGTAPSSTDDPDEIGAFVMLRAQWTALQGGSVREGLLHDAGPSGKLVVEGVGEPFLRYLEAVYEGGTGLGDPADLAAFDDAAVPGPLRGYATILRVQRAVEEGQPDLALDLLDGWEGSRYQRPYTDRLDALRGDALLLAGRVEDAVAWARAQVSAANDELSPFGVRLAARGLATALYVQGDGATALRALSVVLRLGRCGPLHSGFDERIFGLAAVLHARQGHGELARMLLDELEATPRPYALTLDFIRPWARMEVTSALDGGTPDGEPLWAAGERLRAEGKTMSAAMCWALTPARLDLDRLAALEQVVHDVEVPLLAPLLRLQRRMSRGTSTEILESLRPLRFSGPLRQVAIATAREAAVRERGQDLTDAEVAALTGHAADEGAGLAPVVPLTVREEEIVDLARDGLSNREIASRLFVSVRTVESHLYRAMQKLGISQRADLG